MHAECAVPFHLVPSAAYNLTVIYCTLLAAGCASGCCDYGQDANDTCGALSVGGGGLLPITIPTGVPTC